MTRIPNPVCIYHANCADGFTSAWVMNLKFGDTGLDLVPGAYNSPPPLVSGRRIFLNDFSYKRPDVISLLAANNSIELLDHHESALRNLDGLDELFPRTFDSRYATTKHSGAMIAWNFCFPNAAPPLLVKYVQDRDLWKFELPHSRAINAWIFSYEYTLDNWDEIDSMLRTSFGDCVLAGEAIERKHHKDIRELLAVCTRETFAFHEWAELDNCGFFALGILANEPITIASLPYTMSSDAAHAMAEQSPQRFAMCYWDTPTSRVFSLRSADDGPAVNKIAEAFGGGGHPKAAGFSVPRGHILATC